MQWNMNAQRSFFDELPPQQSSVVGGYVSSVFYVWRQYLKVKKAREQLFQQYGGQYPDQQKFQVPFQERSWQIKHHKYLSQLDASYTHLCTHYALVRYSVGKAVCTLLDVMITMHSFFDTAKLLLCQYVWFCDITLKVMGLCFLFYSQWKIALF